MELAFGPSHSTIGLSLVSKPTHYTLPNSGVGLQSCSLPIYFGALATPWRVPCNPGLHTVDLPQLGIPGYPYLPYK